MATALIAGVTPAVAGDHATAGITGSASAISAQSGTAMLSATIPGPTTAALVQFFWGSGESLTQVSDGVAIVAAGSAQTVSVPISGLLPGQRYHFRVVEHLLTGQVTSPAYALTVPALPAAVTGNDNGHGPTTTTDATPTPTTSSGTKDNGSGSENTGTTGGGSGKGSSGNGSSGPGTGSSGTDSGKGSTKKGSTKKGSTKKGSSNTGSSNTGSSNTGSSNTGSSNTGSGTGSTPTKPTGGDSGPGTGPAPVIGQTVVAGAASGTVSVQTPGAAPAPLTAATTVPEGSLIDATHGSITLSAVRNTSGAVNSGTFWGARFTVRHPKGHPGMTELVLHESSSCPKAGQARAARASRPVVGLWGHDHHGRFRTRGRNSVATVRGTTWYMAETCKGTVTGVLSGTVDVRDLHTGHVTVLRVP